MKIGTFFVVFLFYLTHIFKNAFQHILSFYDKWHNLILFIVKQLQENMFLTSSFNLSSHLCMPYLCDPQVTYIF
jgi:hypothetical protein